MWLEHECIWSFLTDLGMNRVLLTSVDCDTAGIFAIVDFTHAGSFV